MVNREWCTTMVESLPFYWPQSAAHYSTPVDCGERTSKWLVHTTDSRAAARREKREIKQ
jgi:hypothetical protein